jgi:hypothetical protein
MERDERIKRIAAAILARRRKRGYIQPIHRTQSRCDLCRGQASRAIAGLARATRQLRVNSIG